MKITKGQARKYLLIKHGLYGEYIFSGKEGIYSFIEQAGCIQYDPIDVCGKNHELVLQSRVEGFKKPMLYDLLYKDKRLVDWFDKNQAIMPISDWPYFSHHRDSAKKESYPNEHVGEVASEILEHIRQNGEVCSSDLEYSQKVDWWWAPSTLAKVALESLYLRGELVISDKKNTRRYYDIPERHIPAEILTADNPNTTEIEIVKWHLLRRISSVGLLKNSASDAFLGIRNFKAKQRNEAFKSLLKEKRITEVAVEESEKPFYIHTSDIGLLKRAVEDKRESERLEFIAPLDNLMWDRKIVEELFGFSYRWEIYTPAKNRKYGYYVLPVLYGDRFIARIELKRDRKNKKIENLGLWWEDISLNNINMQKKIKEHLERFNEIMY